MRGCLLDVLGWPDLAGMVYFYSRSRERSRPVGKRRKKEGGPTYLGITENEARAKPQLQLQIEMPCFAISLRTVVIVVALTEEAQEKASRSGGRSNRRMVG